jgi:hypothetical protein
MPAGNLSWMIASLCLAGVPNQHRLIVAGAERLVGMQNLDGRWVNDDGTDWEIHATLEALYALKLCEQL